MEEVNQEQSNLGEHEQAMLAKVEANEAKTQQEMMPDNKVAPTEEPEETLYAGKYKSVEDMEKAYKELESKLGNNDSETKEASTEAEEGDTISTEAEAKEVAEAKGVDFTKLNDEFAANGELSEDTYKTLEGKGIDKATVDAYIDGQKALVEQNIGKLQSLVGGQDEYTNMIEWATENLNDGEKEAFNNSLKNQGQAEFAIQGLAARYKAEVGSAPKLIKGDTQVRSNGYQSKQEMTVDMHDARYKKDPAFRAMVQGKIARSNW